MRLDIDFITSIAQERRSALSPFAEHSWESFYEKIQNYQEVLCKTCSEGFGRVVDAAWKECGLPRSGLFCPVSTYYVNSQVLKTRVACPTQPQPQSHFADFFSVYEEVISDRNIMKRVFGSATREDGGLNGHEDHFLGFLTDGRFHSDKMPIVLTIQNQSVPLRKRSSLSFTAHLRTHTGAVKRGVIQDHIIRAVRKKIYAISDLTARDLPARTIRRMIGPPIQFVTFEGAVTNPGSLPIFPFYPKAFFPWPIHMKWRAVHYLYFPEYPAFPTSSGCVLLLVEETDADLPLNLKEKIEKSFVPLVRAGMCSGIAHVVARTEEAIMSGAFTQHSNGAHIIYPDHFALQTSPHVPLMPILNPLKELKTSPAFTQLQIQLDAVIDCLTYLVDADNALTSGYVNIVEPILYSVKRLWFSFKTVPPPDIPQSILQWSQSFRNTMRDDQKTLDNVDERLLQVLTLALGIEHDLGDIPSYREHFVHSFHVFCIGLCLLRVLVDVQPYLKNPRVMYKTVRKWFFVAMWHDTGYAVEKLEYLSNRYVAAIRRKKPSDHSDYYRVPFHPNFGHLLVHDVFFDELQDNKSHYLNPTAYNKLFASKDIGDLRRAVRRQLISKAQHGVLSALVFLNDAKELINTHGLSDANIGEIGLAMALHHIAKEWFETNPADDDKEEADFQARMKKWQQNLWTERNISASMLILGDITAQWGRNFEQGEAEPCRLESVKLTPGILEIEMRYPESTKDKIAKKFKKWYATPFDNVSEGKGLLKLVVSVGPADTKGKQVEEKTIFSGIKS